MEDGGSSRSVAVGHCGISDRTCVSNVETCKTYGERTQRIVTFDLWCRII